MSEPMDDKLDLVADAAAEWCVRLSEGDLTQAEQQDLDAWFAADPVHRELLDDAVTAWRAVDEQASHPGMIALRGEALNDLRRAQRRRWGSRPGRRAAVWSAAAAVVAAVALGGALAWRASLPDVYRTTEGERRIVELADGSRASLDADTVLKVRYDGDRRRLWLEQGRAKFAVAKDPLRPFSVAAGGKLVVATGTTFSVERVADQMRVVLYEGHVAVLDGEGAKGPSAAAAEGRRRADREIPDPRPRAGRPRQFRGRLGRPHRSRPRRRLGGRPAGVPGRADEPGRRAGQPLRPRQAADRRSGRGQSADQRRSSPRATPARSSTG
ncbi:FecR family protein [Caulobacter segnis]